MPESLSHFGSYPASCPNPLFSGIVFGFLLSFPASRPDPLVIPEALEHRARIPYFSASCLVFFYLSQHRARISFVFSGIALGSYISPENVSDFLLSFLALCPNFLCFLRHRIWILYLSRKLVRFSSIFSGIVSEFPLFSLAVCLGPFVLRSSWLIPLASLWLCEDKIVGHLNSSLEFISLIHCLHFAFMTHSFIYSTEEGHIFRPSILSLDTCILSYGCHMHPCFHMTPSWPPFGLDWFLSLV